MKTLLLFVCKFYFGITDVHQETSEQFSLNLTQKEQKYHYLKISIQEEKHYNFLINLEKKIHEPVKLFKLDNTENIW